MDDLGRTDCRQVPIPLVGEDETVGPGPLDTGGDGRSAAMGRLDHVDVEIAVEKDRTPHRGHPDGPLLHPELVHSLGHQTVDRAVVATWAEMGLYVLEASRPF